MCPEVTSSLFRNLHPDDPDYDPATSGNMANIRTSEFHWMFREIISTNRRTMQTNITGILPDVTNPTSPLSFFAMPEDFDHLAGACLKQLRKIQAIFEKVSK